MAHVGLQTRVPLGRFALSGHVEPGISSFSSVARLYNATGSREYRRVTHFSLIEGLQLERSLTRKDAIHFDVSRMMLIEGDVRQGLGQNSSLFLPGNTEGHLLVGVSLAHSFGQPVPAEPVANRDSLSNSAKSAVVVSWVTKPQVHLESEDLSVDRGVAISGCHFLKNWLALDGSLLVLPGGDQANYQDGGTETEAFFGIKAGVHRSSYGFYLGVRPGFASFTRTYYNETTYPPKFGRTTDFAANYGAIVEAYPTSSRLMLRLDISEMLTSYSAVNVQVSTTNTIVQVARTSISPLFMAGAGWRF